jgi:hypothetical protein
MTFQPDMLDWLATRAPASRATDPDTSHQAAETHQITRAHDRMAVLLAHAAHQSGLTDFELADIVNRQQTSAGKRRGELRDLGMIEATDQRRPAPSGSAAIVWKITQLGREFVRGMSA